VVLEKRGVVIHTQDPPAPSTKFRTPVRNSNADKQELDTEEAAKALRIPPVFLAQLIYEGRLRLRRGFLLNRSEVESMKEYSQRRFTGYDP
jgi:hypothetical protein